ncbi:MAG: hypothetical protein K2N78_13230, partial [Oscillospiraceae bacterium]|nr:hypothetical protein [Oscillospiraceae bacterium]
MEELAIRRNRSFAAPQRQTVSRTEKQSAAAGTQKTVRGTGLSVSETLRQLMERVNQAAGHLRESRRTLQTGEGVLAEVQEKLGRMAELAEEASGEGADREALQAELEQLRGEVDRMLNSPSGAALFSDEGAESAEEAGASEGSAAGETVVPEWLLKAVAQGKLDADQILAALGLDKSASGADVLAALAGRLPENDPTAALLASLYLGAVISGGPNAGDMDPTMALDGLRLLLEKTAQGMPLDEAIRLLTNGEYTSLADFQEQFSGGAMPGLEEFLTNLLLTGGGNLLQEMEMPSLLTFMAGTGGMEMDLLMALMTAGEAQASAPEAGQENALAQNTAAEAAETVGSAGNSAAETAGMTGTAGTEGASGPMEVMRFGGLQVMGRDLSAVAYDEASGKLTIGGTADVTVRGAGEQTVEVTGSGTVTVQNLRATLLTVDSAGARIVTVGENTLGEVRLGQSTVLTLDGGGLLRAGTVRGGEHALLRMAGGALEVAEGAENGAPGILTVPVVLEG